jgi:ligand-binding sensor domain-containing protein/two-component sensor histidine kinase
MRWWLPVILLFVFVAECLAQQSYSYPITTEQGLPSREVYRIVQDSDGFLWIGCNAGLFRYDGVEFRPFRNAGQTGRSVSNLAFDREGRLWCGNFSGQVFRVEGDSMRMVTDWSKFDSQFPVFRFDENGHVWLTSDDGAHRLAVNGEDHRAAIFPEKEATGQSATASLDIAPDGRVIVFSPFRGFFIVDGENAAWLAVKSPTEPPLEARVYFARRAGKLHAFLIPNGSDVCHELAFDGEKMQHVRSHPIRSRINRIATDAIGRVWVSTNAGAYQMDRPETVLMAGDRISDVFLDREGTLWITSLESGIHAIPSLEISYFEKEGNARNDAHLTTLCRAPNGQILMGHFNGRISRLTEQGDLAEVLPADPNRHRRTERIHVDADGRMTIARGPLTTVSPTGAVSENDIGGNMKDFRLLPGDSLLMANVEGLMLMHRENRDVTQRTMLRKGRCQKVALGKDGTVWAAFRDGVFKGESPRQLTPVEWSGTRVYATDLREDGSGGVWVSTISEGIFHFKENGETVHVSVENGLTSNETHAIFPASDTLWIANNRGLDRVVGTEVVFFGLQDGLEVNETNDMLVDVGNVFLATHDGLVRIPTSLNPVNTAPPRLHLTAVMARDSTLSAEAMRVLTHDLNDLRITLAVAAFRSRGTALVRYRLLGLDTAWAEAIGNRADIRYNALPEGDFIFEAYALNEDGIRSAETIVLTFTVLPPFYRTLWFYLLCALVIAGAVAAFFSWRIRRIRERAALEHEAVSSRLTALKAQMNPHFLFNALNSIQELILQKDVANGLKYLGKFGSLTRQILETSGRDEVTLQTEIDMLTDYLELEKLRFGDSFVFGMHVSDDIDPEGILIPPMLIQPYVENALKHGLLHRQTDRRLSVSFSSDGEMLQVTVRDNGIGRRAAGEIEKRQSGHRSFSTSATAKRLELLRTESGAHGSVEILDLTEKGMAMGTEVRLRIPSVVV